MGNKTSSPRGGKRGCLCKNGKYSSRCCNGELSEQGIGSLKQQTESVIITEGTARTTIRISS